MQIRSGLLMAGTALASILNLNGEAPPDLRWVQRAGGHCENIGIAFDPAGFVCVKGTHEGGAVFGGVVLRNAGIFLAKYDTNGNLIWAKQAADTTGAEGSSIAVDSGGNIFIAGGFWNTATFNDVALNSFGDSDAYVAKHDSAGNLLWVRQLGGSKPDSGGIAVDAAGPVYVAGSFQGTASFGPTNLTSLGGSDSYLAKFDAAGNVLWVAQAGGAGEDAGKSSAVDPAGNVYLTGLYDGLASFGTTNLSGGAETQFLAKYDSQGRLRWVRKSQGTSIVVDTSGNVYARGSFSGTETFGTNILTSRGADDMFVCKYDSDGNVLWVRQSGGVANDDTEGLALDSAGNCYVTGRVRGDAIFDSLTLTNTDAMTVFVSKYTAQGVLLWCKEVAHCDNDMGSSIALDRAANCYTAGNFSGTAVLDGTSLRNADGWDLAIASLGAATNPLILSPPYFVASLQITGNVGRNIRVDYAVQPDTNHWIPLTNFVLPWSPYWFVDLSSATNWRAGNRFYRAVQTP